MESHAGATSGRQLPSCHLLHNLVPLWNPRPFFVGAFASSRSTWFPQWLFYASAALAFLELATIGCAAVLAISKYRAERALGYTTWPSGDELAQ